MLQTLKKVFTSFVTLTTITWSVGVGALALPSAASAAAVSGDLIKASGPSVYYYAGDGKRYVFPNEKTYFSWYKDFSSVKTVSDSELASIMIGGNVTLRAGTKLAKITTDPKTYAVGPGGVLHWIQSEDVAKALYGSDWAKRVVDVPDAFFVNYTIGSAISTNVHPDGALVKYAGDANTYLVWGGVKRLVTASGLSANGLNVADAVLTTVTYGNGSDLSGAESAVSNVISGVSSNPGVGGGLTVSVASDNPTGATLPKNSSSVKLIKVNLAAGGADVSVTGLRFHRVGVGAASDFSNVYVYDGSGVRMTSGRSVNNTTGLVEFNTLGLVVPAGQTKSVYLYGDLSAPSTTGGQHAFELLDAASVIVSGSSTVAGSFPVRGNVFTVGTQSAARLDVKVGSAPTNPTIGTKQAEVSNFKLVANTNDVSVSQITLYQAGSVTNSDLANFNLYQGTTLVASAAAVSANGHIVLKFSPAYLVQNGTTKVFSLKADVAGRTARTIKTYVEYTTDVSALDTVYNAGPSVDITTNGSFDGAGSNYIELTTQGGQLTNSFNGPATSDIAKGQLGVPLYKFSLTGADNTLEIKKFVFNVYKTNASASSCRVQGSATNYFRSLKIKDLDSNQTLWGPQEFASGTNTATATVTFTDSYNLMAGKTYNLALVADLANSEDTAGDFFNSSACAYKANFVAFGASDVRVVDTGEFLAVSKIVPNSNNEGNALTVKTSSFSVGLASSPGTGTVVKKQANVPVVGLSLSASSQSDITITAVTLASQVDKAVTGCAGFGTAVAANGCNVANVLNRVSSLSLWDGATMVGSAKSPDSSTGQAVISNMNLVIPKGTTKNLTVAATFTSTASSTSPYDKVAVGVASITAQDQDSNTVSPSLSSAVTGQMGTTPSVAQTVIPNGTLTVANDAQPASNIVIGGKDAWIPFARYQMTAQYEPITVDMISVTSSLPSSGSSDNSAFSAIAIAVGGVVKASDSLPSGQYGSKDIDLSLSPISIPKDSSVSFEVWAKLSSVQASSSVSGALTGVARSGHQETLGVLGNGTTTNFGTEYASKLNIRAMGAASGEKLYAATGASAGNKMIVRKSVPVVTKQTQSGTLSNTDQDLLKFSVAADSAGSIAWKQIMFSISKSSATALTNFRLRRGSQDIESSQITIVNATSAADLYTGSIAAGVTDRVLVAVAMASGVEETVTAGSSNVYTLHATVTGAASGQSVNTSIYKDPGSAIVTGYVSSTVTAWGGFAASANNYLINTNPIGSLGTAATGTFMWSDKSEVPHSAALGTAGGSVDWTNDVYVSDVSGVSQGVSW